MTAPLRLTLRRSAVLAGEPGAVALDLRMPSDVADVEAAVELLCRHCFAGQEPCARTRFRLRVALAEALSNAILRGNREDPFKQVRVRAELLPTRIRLTIEDEGDGFDPSIMPPSDAPPSIDDDRGRGLFIIRQLADEVQFSERGNTIWMTLPRC
jgi:serine/threonine-protein kinase RsbW